MSSNTSGKKNILMIVVDQERVPMHFPLDIPMQAHAWLRLRGVSYTNYHVATAPCTPSRSVMFTGWHTPRNGMVDNLDFEYVGPLDPDIPTLGDMAAKAGYHSVYKGKWHLADFEEMELAGEEAMEPYGFHEYQHYGDLHSMAREGHTHDNRIVSDTIHWLQDHVNYPDRNSGKPFFMVCAVVNPHDVMTVKVTESQQQDPAQISTGFFMPIRTPPDHELYRAMHVKEMCRSWHEDFLKSTDADRPGAHWQTQSCINYSFGTIPQEEEASWKALVDYYINCQRDVDREIMRLLQYLEDSGLDRDTIVIFTADHGEMAGAHGLRNKGPYLYKENCNVPLIICHPDGRRNVECGVLGSALDLAPTLIALCGGDRADFARLYGHDLSEAVFDATFVGPRQSRGALFMYSALSTLDADFASGISPTPNLNNRGLLMGIVTPKYKFGRYFSPTVTDPMPITIGALRSDFDLELFDLAADPDEITNLAFDPNNDVLILELNALLNALIHAELQGVSSLIPERGMTPKDAELFRLRYR